MFRKGISRMMGNSFEIRLRNAEGIPVVRLGGKLTQTAIRMVDGYLRRLADAGHFNVVVNVDRAEAGDWRCLSALSETVHTFQAHYGAVNLVASLDKTREVLSIDLLATLFKLCRTESEAILRIKGLLRHPAAITETNARLLEPR